MKLVKLCIKYDSYNNPAQKDDWYPDIHSCMYINPDHVVATTYSYSDITIDLSNGARLIVDNYDILAYEAKQSGDEFLNSLLKAWDEVISYGTGHEDDGWD